MKLEDLVEALMNLDSLRARQWVADALANSVEWATMERPAGLSREEMAVAAGVAELLAQRAAQQPPAWTSEIQQSPTKIWLVRWAESMPRLRRLCEQEGPEPLRRRQVLAPPEFLTVA
jgi:hypothetical protein